MFYPWLFNNSNSIVNEINSNYVTEVLKLHKNSYNVKIKIDLKKCNNLYNFLILVQNKKDKISSNYNLSERLYQKISLKDSNKNYTDRSGNNIHLIIKIENKDNQFIKYPVIPVL